MDYLYSAAAGAVTGGAAALAVGAFLLWRRSLKRLGR